MGTAPATETFTSYSTKDGLAKCFVGRNSVVDFLLTRGVDPPAATSTGLSAFHWAANRGNLDTVKSSHRTKGAARTERNITTERFWETFWSECLEESCPLIPRSPEEACTKRPRSKGDLITPIHNEPA